MIKESKKIRVLKRRLKTFYADLSGKRLAKAEKYRDSVKTTPYKEPPPRTKPNVFGEWRDGPLPSSIQERIFYVPRDPKKPLGFSDGFIRDKHQHFRAKKRVRLATKARDKARKRTALAVGGLATLTAGGVALKALKRGSKSGKNALTKNKGKAIAGGAGGSGLTALLSRNN